MPATHIETDCVQHKYYIYFLYAELWFEPGAHGIHFTSQGFPQQIFSLLVKAVHD